MRCLRLLAPVLLVLTALTGALATLHRLGDASWAQLPTAGEVPTWLASTPPEDAVMALLRLLALAAIWWVLASTIAYSTAAALRVERGRALLRPLTPPLVRRLADQAVALVLAAGIVVGSAAPALAAPPPPPYGGPATVEPVERDAGGATPDAGSAPDDEPAPDEADPQQPSEARPSGGASQGADDEAAGDDQDHPTTVTVRTGDHLWGLAAAHLAEVEQRSPDDLSDAEIAVHWREVIAVNTDRLVSGDPDLIYPGETVRLPPRE